MSFRVRVDALLDELYSVLGRKRVSHSSATMASDLNASSSQAAESVSIALADIPLPPVLVQPPPPSSTPPVSATLSSDAVQTTELVVSGTEATTIQLGGTQQSTVIGGRTEATMTQAGSVQQLTVVGNTRPPVTFSLTAATRPPLKLRLPIFQASHVEAPWSDPILPPSSTAPAFDVPSDRCSPASSTSSSPPLSPSSLQQGAGEHEKLHLDQSISALNALQSYADSEAERSEDEITSDVLTTEVEGTLDQMLRDIVSQVDSGHLSDVINDVHSFNQSASSTTVEEDVQLHEVDLHHTAGESISSDPFSSAVDEPDKEVPTDNIHSAIGVVYLEVDGGDTVPQAVVRPTATALIPIETHPIMSVKVQPPSVLYHEQPPPGCAVLVEKVPSSPNARAAFIQRALADISVPPTTAKAKAQKVTATVKLAEKRVHFEESLAVTASASNSTSAEKNPENQPNAAADYRVISINGESDMDSSGEPLIIDETVRAVVAGNMNIGDQACATAKLDGIQAVEATIEEEPSVPPSTTEEQLSEARADPEGLADDDDLVVRRPKKQTSKEAHRHSVRAENGRRSRSTTTRAKTSRSTGTSSSSSAALPSKRRRLSSESDETTEPASRVRSPSPKRQASRRSRSPKWSSKKPDKRSSETEAQCSSSAKKAKTTKPAIVGRPLFDKIMSKPSLIFPDADSKVLDEPGRRGPDVRVPPSSTADQQRPRISRTKLAQKVQRFIDGEDDAALLFTTLQHQERLEVIRILHPVAFYNDFNVEPLLRLLRQNCVEAEDPIVGIVAALRWELIDTTRATHSSSANFIFFNYVLPLFLQRWGLMNVGTPTINQWGAVGQHYTNWSKVNRWPELFIVAPTETTAIIRAVLADPACSMSKEFQLRVGQAFAERPELVCRWWRVRRQANAVRRSVTGESLKANLIVALTANWLETLSPDLVRVGMQQGEDIPLSTPVEFPAAQVYYDAVLVLTDLLANSNPELAHVRLVDRSLLAVHTAASGDGWVNSTNPDGQLGPTVAQLRDCSLRQVTATLDGNASVPNLILGCQCIDGGGEKDELTLRLPLLNWSDLLDELQRYKSASGQASVTHQSGVDAATNTSTVEADVAPL